LVTTNHCEQEWNLAAFEAWGIATNLHDLSEPAEVIRLIENRLATATQPTDIRMLSNAVKSSEQQLPEMLKNIFKGTTILKKTTTAQHV
jgi:hypothetical protein